MHLIPLLVAAVSVAASAQVFAQAYPIKDFTPISKLGEAILIVVNTIFFRIKT